MGGGHKTIDWLHIPKTGTSFLYSLLIYACDQQAMQMFFSNGTADGFMRSSHTIKNPKVNSCVKQWYHQPLDANADLGHKGHPVENVFTMIRNPVDRIASGFVHNLHDCSDPTFAPNTDRSKVAKLSCNALAGSDPVSIAVAEETVIKYSMCAKGCQARMILGGSGRWCGHRQVLEIQSTKHIEAISEQAQAKLGRFAFVGITGRWSESMCIFGKMFPRESGKPYPQELVNHNVRPVQGRTCEDRVADVLRANPVVAFDFLDEGIFAEAEERLEKALRQYPECKLSRRMHGMGFAMWV